MASPRVSHKEEYPPRDGKKEILNRICRCVRIINTPSVAPNDRSDAAEVQPYASASRLGELRYPHQQCSETLHQYIGKARQQHSKLIGDEAKTACPVGKEIQLLLLDAVSHLPSCAIDIFIQIPSAAGKIGDDVTVVLSKRTEFRLGKYPANDFPSSHLILKFCKELSLLPALQILLIGDGTQFRSKFDQPIVFSPDKRYVPHSSVRTMTCGNDRIRCRREKRCEHQTIPCAGA